MTMTTIKLPVKNLQSKKVGDVEVPEAVFAYPYKEHLIHEAVEAVRAAARRGTHKVKTRAEVAGSGRKLWRQKGTGRARVGDVRNPKWRKGGIVHGPQVRSHATGMTAREKRNALKSALSRKLADGAVMVIDDLTLSEPKTGALAKALAGLGIDGKALLVDRFDNENLNLASRNNRSLKAVDAMAVNVYDVIDRSHLVFSQGALTRLVEVLSK